MPTVRIIGGACRSRRISVPGGVRPTLGRVRENLFNRLGQDLVGKRALDLFAGAGTLGLEALSRGAFEAVFVEKRRTALERIRKNAERLGVGGERAKFVCQDVHRWLRTGDAGGFDFVFADPPYSAGTDAALWRKLLRLLRGACAENAVVYCESPRETRPGARGWDVLHEEDGGETRWTLLHPAAGAAQ